MTDAANGDKVRLTSQQVEGEEGEGLADWRILFNQLHARFETGSFAKGLDLVNRIGAAAEERNHHPDIDLTYPRVVVRLTSHDTGGVTRRDVELARVISGFAAELGAAADPSAVQVLEIGLDSVDSAEIRPFWAAVLGLDPSAGDATELVDGSGRLPALWFQESEAHEPPRQRFHIDIRVPPEVAEARIQAAIEAGGTLVSDEQAPRFWVLADPQGNKACVCTWVGRTH
jgi:4a-hydroxytetrahydrobiopterin dehydratase